MTPIFGSLRLEIRITIASAITITIPLGEDEERGDVLAGCSPVPLPQGNFQKEGVPLVHRQCTIMLNVRTPKKGPLILGNSTSHLCSACRTAEPNARSPRVSGNKGI